MGRVEAAAFTGFHLSHDDLQYRDLCDLPAKLVDMFVHFIFRSVYKRVDGKRNSNSVDSVTLYNFSQALACGCKNLHTCRATV